MEMEQSRRETSSCARSSTTDALPAPPCRRGYPDPNLARLGCPTSDGSDWCEARCRHVQARARRHAERSLGACLPTPSPPSLPAASLTYVDKLPRQANGGGGAHCSSSLPSRPPPPSLSPPSCAAASRLSHLLRLRCRLLPRHSLCPSLSAPLSVSGPLPPSRAPPVLSVLRHRSPRPHGIIGRSQDTRGRKSER